MHSTDDSTTVGVDECTYSKETGEYTVTTEDAYTLEKQNRSDGSTSMWSITKKGSSTPCAAITSPMHLYEGYEDCEERTRQLYGNKNDDTAAPTQAKASTTASQAKAWVWEASSLSNGASDTGTSTGKTPTYTSSAKSSGTRDWAKPSLSSKKTSSSKKASGSSDKKKSETVASVAQAWYDKLTAFYNKDADTAAGKDLKEDEPLSVPDITKEMRSLSSSVKSTHPLIQHAARETMMLTAAMSRQQVVYGRVRSYYYGEHQEAVKTRKERITSRQTKLKYITNIGNEITFVLGTE